MNEQLRALDTNVLLRYLLHDIPDQFEKARRLIDSETPLGLTSVVVAEAAWTLTGPHYHVDSGTVAARLIDLLARANLVALGFDKAEAQHALAGCLPSTGAADFGDALIAATARSFGVTEIYSFDRRLERAGLVTVSPA